VTLHETLKATFRGCVIPFRPGKTSVNSTAVRGHKGSFLKDRAYAIKCYLHKITHHPEIKGSTVRARGHCQHL
jgi:PX domain